MRKLQLTNATGMDIAKLMKQDTTIGMENLHLLMGLEKTIEDASMASIHVASTVTFLILFKVIFLGNYDICERSTNFSLIF